MSTDLTVRVNYVDADLEYGATGAGYIDLDLANDYLIWTQGSDTVEDLMTAEPTASELNEASTIIDDSSDTQVPLCLLMDYSHDVGGSYYTHEVKGMGDNKRYVFNFSFNGATATEPQLEAWDDDNHNTTDNHVLGDGTPADSFVKAVATTNSLPGASWAGTPIAGSDDILEMNDGNGALAELATGETSHELYANIKIVIPAGYSEPAIETFVLTVRYTWN
jgi:hypothetical protein